MISVTPEHKTLTAVLACQVAVFAMDEVRGTEAYRQEVKQCGNRFLRAIERYTAQQIPLVYGVQDDAMFALMEYQQQMIQKLLRLRPEDMGVVNAMIDMYTERPEQVMEVLGVAFCEQEN